MHFRSTNIQNVELSSQKAWQEIIEAKTAIPTPLIRLYNENGEYTGTRVLTTSTTTDTQFPELTEEEYQAMATTATTEHHTPSLSLTFNPDNPHSSCIDISNLASDDSNTSLEKEIQVLVNSVEVEASELMDSTLLTKAARAIERVTGSTQTLIEFDFLRDKLKGLRSKKKTPSGSQKEEYTDLLAKQHTITNSKIYQLKQEIRRFEKEFYNKHNGFPDISTPGYSKLRKTLQRGKSLLSNWDDFEL